MAKRDFTNTDRDLYSEIIEDTKNTKDTAGTKGKKATRPYTRLDVTKEAPEEYRFTVRLPGEYGVFMNEMAYLDRTSITAAFERLVKEEMERRPDVFKSLNKLNKAGKK